MTGASRSSDPAERKLSVASRHRMTTPNELNDKVFLTLVSYDTSMLQLLFCLYADFYFESGAVGDRLPLHPVTGAIAEHPNFCELLYSIF